MALNNIQERIERSIFEAIRLILVKYGYTPDVANTTLYPETPTGQVAFNTAQATIKTTQGFAIGLYGHSSSQDKATKDTPRIVIIPRRIMPGSIGNPAQGGFQFKSTDPNKVVIIRPPLDSSDMGLDIHLVSSTAKQDRVLHAILQEAIGVRNFIKLYDNPNAQPFFIKQYNYNDIPDTIEGEEEKVYSYEVPDLYLFEGITSDPVPLINEIQVNFQLNSVDTDSLTVTA